MKVLLSIFSFFFVSLCFAQVGIGTTNPHGQFEVFRDDGITTVGDFVVDPDNKKVYVGRISGTPYNSTDFIVRNRLQHETFVVSAANYISLGNYNGAQEQMRVVFDGNTFGVGIGTIAPTAKLTVIGSANKTGGGEWAVFSDERSKENIKNYNRGLDELLLLRPVSFNYKKEFDWGTDTYVGLIAQEVEKIVPTMVHTKSIKNIPDFKELDPNEITYMLINAVKEFNSKIQNLEAEKTEKDSKIEALEKRLERIEKFLEKISE